MFVLNNYNEEWLTANSCKKYYDFFFNRGWEGAVVVRQINRADFSFILLSCVILLYYIEMEGKISQI